MTRYLLYAAAIWAGIYAAVSWTFGLLTDAGVAGATSAACVLLAEGFAYCQRRSWDRARRVREQVWERRLRDEPISACHDGFVYTFGLKDEQLMPAEQFDALARSLEAEAEAEAQGAMWPHDIGGFE